MAYRGVVCKNVLDLRHVSAYGTGKGTIPGGFCSFSATPSCPDAGFRSTFVILYLEKRQP
jgi:hypothetical protein